MNIDEYISKGFDIIPCQKNSKQPKGLNWQDQITDKNNFSENDNIGLHLLNFIDIDIDNPFCHKFLDQIKSKSNLIYGRKSNPNSHILFKGKSKFKKWSFPKEFENYFSKFDKKGTILELRSGKGKQSIIPGSIINGEPVEWSKFDTATEYNGNLEQDLNLVVFATILSVIYPAKGNRDQFCYAVACVLAKWGGWSADKINQFIERLSEVNNDDTFERSNKGSHAHDQIAKNQKIMGLKTLSEITNVSVAAIKDVFKIINIYGKDEDNQVQDLKMYDLQEYFNLDIQKPSFIIERLIKENSINFISGPKGNGKTEFTLGLTHAIASGGKFLRYTAHEPRPIIYVDGEMDPFDIKERSISYTQNKFPDPYYFNIINYSHQKDQKLPDIKFKEGQDLILKSIKEIENKTTKKPVLVLDNLRSLSNYKENDSDEWRPIGLWLLQLRALEIVTIVIDHHGKNSDGGPRGSSSKTDWANVSLFVNSVQKGRTKNKIRLRLKFDKARGLRPDETEDFECEYDFNGNWEIAQVPQNIEVGNICKQIFDIYEAAKIEKEKKLEDLKYQLRMNEINIPQYRLEENAINKKYKVSQKDIAKKLDMAVGKVNKILNEHYPTWQKNNNLWGNE